MTLQRQNWTPTSSAVLETFMDRVLNAHCKLQTNKMD